MGKAFRTLGFNLRSCERCLHTLILVFFGSVGFGSAFAASGQDTIQFDPFLGYNNEIREGGWFPAIFEVENDGPTFTGTIEISSGDYSSQQTRSTIVELPTNTRKRIIIPCYSGSRYGVQWNARLLDERGKVRSERGNLPALVATAESVILGCMPLSFAGMPTFPEMKDNASQVRMVAARIDVDHFPDTSLPLEGLDALYLSSDKAVSLKPPQAMALVNWVRSGGRLIFVVEQITHVNSTPWLQQFLPMELTGVENMNVDQSIHAWMQSPVRNLHRPAVRRPPPQMRQERFSADDHIYRNQPRDAAFENASMAVITGRVRDGETLLNVGEASLIVRAPRGKGSVTLFTFSPEREPFKSWKNRPWFWARILEVPS